ncbi:MAG: hypothetical protein KatS3mg102_2021 [Planctomycetota bacterium]|nr:MAG: hypothetical protein KatS3mg102_2021 [Planctomycetota bacterium]
MRSRVSQLGWMVAVAALAAWLGGGCAGPATRGETYFRAEKAPPMGPQGVRQPGERPRFEQKELEGRGLEELWAFYLGEPVRGLWIFDEWLIVATAPGSVWGVELETGFVRWKYELPDGLSYPPGSYAYRDEGLSRAPELYLISRDVLHVVDRNVGALLWKYRLPFAAASPPVGSDSHIYIGSWDDRLYAISKSLRYVEWSYRTGAPVTAPVAVAERTVDAIYVGSEDGNLYAMNPVADERKWAFPTRGRIVAAPTYHRTFVYVVSQDMNVYCIEGARDVLRWRYASGSPLSQKPIGFGRETLAVVADDGRLLCLNLRPEVRKENLRWSAEGIVRVIAKTRRAIVALRRDGKLMAFDEETGEERWRPLVTGADVHGTNEYDPSSPLKAEQKMASIIPLGYKDGWLVALREKRDF